MSDILNNSFSTDSYIKRREFPRYLTKSITVELQDAKNLKTLSKGKTINISKNGFSGQFNKAFYLSQKVNINLKAKINNKQKEYSCKGRIMWQQKHNNKFHQGINLILFNDKNKKDNLLSKYIEIYKNGLKVDENRSLDRRKSLSKSDKNIKTTNKRKKERRLNKTVFLKCKKYNRMKDLRQYYSYERQLTTGSKNNIIINGKKCINFGSNNYLGLSTHPEVVETAIKTSEKYGVGSGGVRLLSGTMNLHRELEIKLAKFKGNDDSIVYPSGYGTNIGVISAIADEKTCLIIDEKSHASIIDGCYLSKSEIVSFRHNNMLDLEIKLKKTLNVPNKLIITDGVFSMDGDIAKLDDIYDLSEKYHAGIMVDDAHATGVIGKHGKGTASYFDLEGKIDLSIGTLSKSIGCIGGFVVADKDIIHYLKHSSRAFIFSTSLPPLVCASAIKSIEILERDTTIVDKLNKNIAYIKKLLLENNFNIGETETAIIPIIIGNELLTYKIVKLLEEKGIFVNPVVYPAVRKRESRLRVSVMATHTKKEIEYLVDVLKALFIQNKIEKGAA